MAADFLASLRAAGSSPSPYWPGGLVPQPDAPESPAQPESLLLPVEYEAFGTVRGYRWWTIGAPDLAGSPAAADRDWDPDLRDRLRGARDTWQPGLNIAVCKAWARSYSAHPPEAIPDPECSCGFWAYWRLQPHELGDSGRVPVCGVIEGSGDVEIAEGGFRCSQARITALHVPVVFQLAVPYEPAALPERRMPWYKHPKFTGKVINIGIIELPPAPLLVRQCEHGVPVTDECTGCRADSDQRMAWAKVASEAWLAVIGDRLEQMYPGVTVFQSAALMQAEFPPDPQYGHLTGTCIWCGETTSYRHELGCRKRRY